MTRDIINQVRELLDRHLGINDISNRLNLDLDTVKTASNIIRKFVT